MQNTQVLLFRAVCGVGVGAAVPTGIGIRILSVKKVPIWCGNSFVSIQRWMNRMIFQFDSSLEEEKDKKKNPPGQEEFDKNSPSINSSNGVVTLEACVRDSNIILIQGLPYTNHERGNQVVLGSPEKQCESWLNMTRL